MIFYQLDELVSSEISVLVRSKNYKVYSLYTTSEFKKDKNTLAYMCELVDYDANTKEEYDVA